jgi:hypothetical protein
MGKKNSIIPLIDEMGSKRKMINDILKLMETEKNQENANKYQLEIDVMVQDIGVNSEKLKSEINESSDTIKNYEYISTFLSKIIETFNNQKRLYNLLEISHNKKDDDIDINQLLKPLLGMLKMINND